MIAHPYRVAIARILSDLIKADKLIERSEISLYNTLRQQFGITQQDSIAAQYITITEAMNRVRELDNELKQILQNALLQTAQADNQCVAREALILLALKYILQDTTGKYELLSCDTHGSYIEDKFMVYIESDECEEVNDELLCDFDAICDKLRLWNFDFVYIPSLTDHFKHLDADYVKDIIHYMKPTLSDKRVELLYDKLTTISTENFTTELLGAQMNMPQLREVQPSLLINFASSWVLTDKSNNSCAVPQCIPHTDFLRIRLDDTTLHEVKRFIADYDQIITHRESVLPQIDEAQFKYFGFYKVLFDFLALTNNKGDLMEDKLIIDLRRRSLRIGGNEIHLSPTQLTIYILILQQSIRGYGLPHFRSPEAHLSHQTLCDSLSQRFRTILFSLGSTHHDWQFADNTRNIVAYISHITRKLREQVHHAPDVYIPFQVSKDGIDYYTTKVTLDKVYVRVSETEDHRLQDYRPWK